MAGLPKSGPPTLDIGTGIANFTLTVSQSLSVFKIVRLIFYHAVQCVERIPALSSISCIRPSSLLLAFLC